MNTDGPAYGLWTLVLVNSAVFIVFAFSFASPRTRRDWRSFGAFSAFVALFAEMYGFPLTIYLLSGWLGSRDSSARLFTHDSGHLWWTALGAEGSPHLHPIHLMSTLSILAGLLLIGAAWSVLFEAQRADQVATTGPYAHVRHPQYVGFIMILLGFLLQWPTILTLAMFPVLVGMYRRLARREEQEASEKFGDAYLRYTRMTPAFLPRLWLKTRHA